MYRKIISIIAILTFLTVLESWEVEFIKPV